MRTSASTVVSMLFGRHALLRRAAGFKSKLVRSVLAWSGYDWSERVWLDGSWLVLESRRVCSVLVSPCLEMASRPSHSFSAKTVWMSWISGRARPGRSFSWRSARPSKSLMSRSRSMFRVGIGGSVVVSFVTLGKVSIVVLFTAGADPSFPNKTFSTLDPTHLPRYLLLNILCKSIKNKKESRRSSCCIVSCWIRPFWTGSVSIGSCWTGSFCTVAPVSSLSSDLPLPLLVRMTTRYVKPNGALDGTFLGRVM